MKIAALLAASFLHAPAWCALATPAQTAKQVDIESQIVAGRALLDAGKPAEAQVVFEQLAAADDNSLRTYMWVLRSWLPQGRVNDTLNELDKLRSADAKGAEIDYLYGMAFTHQARSYVAQGGVPGGIVQMAFGDAVANLTRATQADAVRYYDAFLPLAECAWMAQDLEVASQAIDTAFKRSPKDVDVLAMRGRIALSRYSAARTDDTQAVAADVQWELARSSFASAIEQLRAASGDAPKLRRAELHQQLGHVFAWKQKSDDAAREYAAAIGLDPGVSAYFDAARGVVTPERFATLLDEAQKAYDEAWGTSGNGDAALRWWAGFARYGQKQHAEAEAAFQQAVLKQPQFTNSWYYIALTRYFRQDYDGTVAALKKNFEADPNDLVNSIQSNAEVLRYIDYMLGLLATKTPPNNKDAAFLSEVQTAVAPDNARYWNNLGLFLRDEGEALEQQKRRKLDETERKYVADLYERAYGAYTRSLELSPDDPNYLNDTALMLHYHLDRDWDQALEMYKRAYERAVAELARTDLSAETRDLRELAKRDAKNNEEKLLRDMQEKKKASEAGTGPTRRP